MAAISSGSAAPFRRNPRCAAVFRSAPGHRPFGWALSNNKSNFGVSDPAARLTVAVRSPTRLAITQPDRLNRRHQKWLASHRVARVLLVARRTTSVRHLVTQVVDALDGSWIEGYSQGVGSEGRVQAPIEKRRPRRGARRTAKGAANVAAAAAGQASGSTGVNDAAVAGDRHRAPLEPLDDPLEAIVAGTAVWTRLPTCAWPAEVRELLDLEVAPLRRQLLDTVPRPDPATILLIDAALTNLLESRYLSLRVHATLSEAPSSDTTRTAERLDRMAHRAHARFLGALDVLQRGRRHPVAIKIAEVGNLTVGEQTVSVAGRPS